MYKTTRKERLYLLRELTYHLIKMFDEYEEVYVFIDNRTQEIIYITSMLENKNYFINLEVYKASLKVIFLHLLKEEYISLPYYCLVLLANRILRNYSISTIAKILNITEEKYLRLESGYLNFLDDVSIEIISYKLNFDILEFSSSNLKMRNVEESKC